MAFYDDAVNMTANYIKSSLHVTKDDIDAYAEDLDMTSPAAFFELVFDSDVYEEISNEGYDNIADEVSVYLSDNLDYSDSEFENLVKSYGDSLDDKDIEYFFDWCNAQGSQVSGDEMTTLMTVRTGSELLDVLKSNENLYRKYKYYLRDSDLLEAFSRYGSTLMDADQFWADVYKKLR